MTRRVLLRRGAVLAVTLGVGGLGARGARAGDPLDALHEFVREARSGRGSFTQTVIPPGDGRRRISSGTFEFLRPDHFRFSYAKPFEQLIVADGSRLWLHDPELNQVTVRRLVDVIGSTPMAILSGRAPDRDFELAPEPPRDGLDWVTATPRRSDSTIRAIRIGFRGRELAALEIADGFGQRSLLQFRDFKVNMSMPAERFRFTPPAGADVISQ